MLKSEAWTPGYKEAMETFPKIVNQISEKDITTDVVVIRCMNDKTWCEKDYDVNEFRSLVDNVNTWFTAVYDRKSLQEEMHM